MKDLLIFSKRLELAEKIEAYITENDIAPDAFGLVTSLSILGLLDIEACKKYLDGDKETVTETDKRMSELRERLINGKVSTEEIQEYLKLVTSKSATEPATL